MEQVCAAGNSNASQFGPLAPIASHQEAPTKAVLLRRKLLFDVGVHRDGEILALRTEGVTPIVENLLNVEQAALPSFDRSGGPIFLYGRFRKRNAVHVTCGNQKTQGPQASVYVSHDANMGIRIEIRTPGLPAAGDTRQTAATARSQRLASYRRRLGR